MKKSVEKRTDQKSSAVLQMIRIVCTMVLLVVVSVSVFMLFYNRYNDQILYAERLNQMQDVTTQLFSGLEDVVGNQWHTADVLCNYIELAKPKELDQLSKFMEKQAKLNNLDTELDNLIAVDSHGRYYTAEGLKGTLQELDYLLDDPERISYVSNTVTTNRTKMVFLERLENPVLLENDSELIYYGFTRDMTELEPYFNCVAYEGNSAVYVIENDGMKLFSSHTTDDSEEGALIKGYNVYHVLENMEYLHESSFDQTKTELEQTGRAYSNAVLNGEEYFYSLYRMENAEWTLVFLVRSSAVAMNTVELVNTTMYVVLTFAVCMAIVCAAYIFWIQRRQQKKELAIVEENNAILEKLNKELEAASKAKSEFLANMSHDIRTPMNAIVGITDLMEREEDTSDKLHTYIHKVQLSSRHLLSLINDVLDMSKIESSEVALNQDSISLAEQVGQVDSIIRPQVTERGQNFEIRVHSIAHEYLIGDGVRLRQIFLNLLSNAVKYTPYGGTIRFDLAEKPCGIPDHATFLITVQDNGCGMEPEFMKHIFEPFSRAENSMTNKVQGTGLGMAITKNIVDLMEGTITVQSKPDEGSRFDVTLTFPIDYHMGHELEAQRVLLISQDDTLSNNVGASLREEEISFSVAATEEEAQEKLTKNPADIILVNGYLHNPNLADMARNLRKTAKDAVLLFCCDYAQPEQVHDLLVNCGIDGLVTRPFFLSNLVRAVNLVQGKIAFSGTEGSILKGMKFLCAEDNDLNAEILNALLKVNGASCTIYPDGEKLVKAFEEVKDGDYDAILMDVQMPKMNGLEATRRIRNGENPLGKTIPVIAMTANAFTEDIQQCLHAGMDAHVAKPLDIAALERTLYNIKNENFSGGGHLFVPRRQRVDTRRKQDEA